MVCRFFIKIEWIIKYCICIIFFMYNLNNRNLKKIFISIFINNLGFFLNLLKYIILYIKSCFLGYVF